MLAKIIQSAVTIRTQDKAIPFLLLPNTRKLLSNLHGRKIQIKLILFKYVVYIPTGTEATCTIFCVKKVQSPH